VTTERRSLVRVTRSETLVLASDDDRRAVREEFEQNHCISVAQFLAPDLLGEVQAEVDQAGFYFRPVPGLSTEERMETNRVSARLHLLMNDDALLRVIGEITGIATGYFFGRVYRRVPGKGHHDNWHDDCDHQRLIGVTVNLSRQAYGGGAVLMRRRGSTDVFSQMRPAQPGDALLFRIHRSLQHRVEDVTGDAPRTVLTGWFHGGGTFRSLLYGNTVETAPE